MPEPVALGIRVPNAMQSLSSVMNVANTAQNLQRGQIDIQRGGQALQQEQMDLQERQALRAFAPRLNEFKKEDGTPDFDRLYGEATRIAPKLGGDFALKAMEGYHKGAAAKQELLRLDIAKRDAIGQVIYANAESPLDKQLAVINAVVQGAPELKHWGEIHAQELRAAAEKGPAALKETAIRIGQRTASIGEQTGAKGGNRISTGGEAVQTSPVAATLAGQPNVNPAAPIPMTLPPTTPTVDPRTGQPTYLGQPPASARRPAAPVAAGNPPGFEPSATGSAATANADWSSTVEAAKTASTDIANLQNIKRFSAAAQTGVGSDRRAFVAGLAGLLGVDYGELTKTNTDLLAKNANMLALAGGDTNLAKTLAESANPNTHMTKEAIQEAANQVMSQRRMALAKQEFLQPHKALNSPDSYGKALTEWNKVADPRIFQWAHMTPEEKAHMKSSMTPKEQDEFRSKIKRSIELGIVK